VYEINNDGTLKLTYLIEKNIFLGPKRIKFSPKMDIVMVTTTGFVQMINATTKEIIDINKKFGISLGGSFPEPFGGIMVGNILFVGSRCSLVIKYIVYVILTLSILIFLLIRCTMLINLLIVTIGFGNGLIKVHGYTSIFKLKKNSRAHELREKFLQQKEINMQEEEQEKDLKMEMDRIETGKRLSSYRKQNNIDFDDNTETYDDDENSRL
jgi:hypothetical protein